MFRAEGVRKALSFAVKNHVTMVISGGTSSGKTTFLNALLKEVPESERVISIEDTRELNPPQPNWLSMLASKGGQGKAQVTIQDLLEASLRLRPDRLFLGEIRGAEAATFLQAVNTGHPGSLTTLHADSTFGAFERLALMTLQSELKLTKAEIMDYVRSVVPDGRAIAPAPDARRRRDLFSRVQQRLGQGYAGRALSDRSGSRRLGAVPGLGSRLLRRCGLVFTQLGALDPFRQGPGIAAADPVGAP